MINKTKSEKGVALLVTLVVLVSIVGLALGLLSLGLADHRESIVNRGLIIATALAEGATEIGQRDLMMAVVNCQSVPTSGIATINGADVSYAIAPVGTQRTITDSDGFQATLQPYSVSATGQWQGISRRVEKIIDLKSVPFYQFTIFYEGDLEVCPGPSSLNIFGRIHTNRDMYLGTDSVLFLNSNHVHAAGHIYRRNQADGTPSGGIVKIKVSGTSKYESMESKKQFAPPSTSGFDSSFLGYDYNKDGDYDDWRDYKPWTPGALELWNGTVKSAEHGIKEIESPSMDTIQAFVPAAGGNYTYDPATGKYVAVAPGSGDYNKGYYYGNAALSVIDGKVYDSTGIEITTWPGGNPLSESTFYDAREQKYVTVTNIDLAKLGKSGKWPDNGLLYAARTEATSSQPNGVRLKNGSALTEPLTVVSQNPVYVWGDYNVGTKKNPKVPAAILTDAFNVLSNNWNDTKSPGTIPKALPTTINVAFMTGSQLTTSGGYDGGFEHLPRFHEKWDGVPCDLTGSFINIWESRIAKGTWAYGGDRYTGRSRDWDYDKDFDNAATLPPFTPSVVYTSRVVWVSR